MNAEEMFEERAYFNKWLKELTQDEREHIISMLTDFARQKVEPIEKQRDNLKDELKTTMETLLKCRKQRDELLGMLNKILRIEDHAFTLKGFDVKRLKNEIETAIKNAEK